jgi:cation diffusion facilitator CzcD-associated flavoprotein CzcO
VIEVSAAVIERTVATPTEVASAWLAALEAALCGRGEFAELFASESYWRDLLVLDWRVDTYAPDEIAARLTAWCDGITAPSGFELAADRTPPRWVTRAGVDAIEAIFRFDSDRRSCQGLVRLVPAGVVRAGVAPADAAGNDVRRFVAWNLLTMVAELAGHESRIGAHRQRLVNDPFAAQSWTDRREEAHRRAEQDPDVLVVGAGQAGLSTAAQLATLDVSTLVIDRYPRVGDNWRRRYRGLTLHNPIWINDLPLLPYPQNWPVYVPKDMLGDWFEVYAKAMDLTVNTETTLSHGDYNTEDGRWQVQLRHGDHSTRMVRPRHIVLATGISDIPNIPSLPGIDAFVGTVIHTGAYASSQPFADKRVLVIGSGTSAHDVAQDLHNAGAHVTLVQRSPTTVASVEPAGILTAAMYAEGIPVDDCDLIAASIPYPVEITAARATTARMRELDQELLLGLEMVGFRLDYGYDGTGHILKYKRRGGGYYLNVGASDLIIAKRIGLLQADRIRSFVSGGVELTDGTVQPCDAVILATGYLGQREGCRAMFGHDIADRVGPVWDYDERGEIRNVWKPSAQDGLWFAAGNFQQCRFYSKVLALQLKARLLGRVGDQVTVDADGMA